jgi:hypothetical protein
MKLNFKYAPREAQQSLEEALRSVALIDPASNVATLKLNLQQQEQLEVEYYNVHLDSTGSLSGLRQLAPTGWAFIVKTTDSRIVDSEYSLAYLAKWDGGFRFTHLQHGWIPATILQTLELAGDGTWRASGSFSPAILHVVGLGRLALWFRGNSEKQDRLVPLIHSAKGERLETLPRANTVTGFFNILRRRWNSRPQFSNAPRGSTQDPAQFDLQTKRHASVTIRKRNEIS